MNSENRTVKFRTPDGLRRAIERGADLVGMTLSEFARQAAIEKLASVGIDARPRQYALVYDGEIVEGANGILEISEFCVGVPELPERAAPGSKWLPVEIADSESFDFKKHWRLTPVYVVQGDCVVCMYPIVPKAMEYA